jgi:hypothetical protein
MEPGRPKMEPENPQDGTRPKKEPQTIKRDPERPEMGHVREMLNLLHNNCDSLANVPVPGPHVTGRFRVTWFANRTLQEKVWARVPLPLHLRTKNAHKTSKAGSKTIQEGVRWSQEGLSDKRVSSEPQEGPSERQVAAAKSIPAPCAHHRSGGTIL